MLRRISTILRLVFVIQVVSFVFLNVIETRAVESLMHLDEKWTGDFDGMVKRHKIRVLTPYSETFYFLDGAKQAGITYEGMKIFEKWLNKELGKKHIRVRVVIIPTPRHRLLPGLVEGRGDIAAGNLTITPGRSRIVDFSDPFAQGAKEIVLAAKEASVLKSLDDLAGKEIVVRPSSSYFDSLKRLNKQFKKAGKKPMNLVQADEYLEDEDLMEMANAGMISFIIVDEHKVAPWRKAFANLRVYPDLTVRTGGELAWAFRKKSPQLKKIINQHVAGHKQGTKLFNIITKRYLERTQGIKNALTEGELQRFSEADEFFIKYAAQYNFDWLMVAALAYQESRIDQNQSSPAGAIGVMQMLPSTAKDPNVNLPNIQDMETNIHAGVKYLRFLRDRYFEKESMDDVNKMFFTMASYNAGPAKVTRLRKKAQTAGFDPSVWFQNVEIVAARQIGQETVQYVSNIYKYYTAYRLIINKLNLKEEKKKAIKQGKSS